uniref:hypothetical protein n=1 Tax=Anaplasma marginale TaxID=770 RepID=UPI001CDAAA4B|nr:hypothetical protein [Anaplasma marginale]
MVLGYPVGQVRAELELAKQSFDVGRGGGPASGHDEGVVGDLYASEGYRYSAVHMKLSSGKEGRLLLLLPLLMAAMLTLWSL